MEQLQPGLRRIVAPNPSPMTFRGTNTYVIGSGAVAIVDPGPADPAHIGAILGGLARGETVSHILVTHAHLDHSPGARLLAEATGAPILAFGPPDAGRSDVMAQLAAAGLAGVARGSITPSPPTVCCPMAPSCRRAIGRSWPCIHRGISAIT